MCQEMTIKKCREFVSKRSTFEAKNRYGFCVDKAAIIFIDLGRKMELQSKK